MKFAILGYGRMGKEVEQQSLARGHEISAVFDIDNPFTKDSDLNGSQAIISFTLPEAAVGNIQTAAALKIPIVEGTTGWYDQLEQLKQQPDLTMIYSPNFSMGVYVFTQLAEYAAKLIAPLAEYDCYLHEWHHTGKADSPSGTANKLAARLLENLPNKDYIEMETCHGKIDPKALHVTSSRVGRVAGVHQIGFDSMTDEIELKHTLHGREGLALGAVKAAEWIAGKNGVFTMEDFMNNLK